LQELPGSLDAAGDDVLVRRQDGGRLELPREVVDADAGDPGQLRQARGGVEVFLDVLDDGAELPRGSVLSGPRSGWRGPERAVSGRRPDDRPLARPILRASVRSTPTRNPILPILSGCNEPGSLSRALSRQTNTWFVADGVPGDRE
jgi:hypothetical protein